MFPTGIMLRIPEFPHMFIELGTKKIWRVSPYKESPGNTVTLCYAGNRQQRSVNKFLELALEAVDNDTSLVVVTSTSIGRCPFCDNALTEVKGDVFCGIDDCSYNVTKKEHLILRGKIESHSVYQELFSAVRQYLARFEDHVKSLFSGISVDNSLQSVAEQAPDQSVSEENSEENADLSDDIPPDDEFDEDEGA